jgi:Zn-finger protein
MSDEVFKGLERQAKEMGQSFWACRSCLSFATKVNHQFKEVTEQMAKINNKVDENTREIKNTNTRVDSAEEMIDKLSRKVNEMEKNLGEGIYEEIRERDMRRLNIVLHDVKEPARSITDSWERIEADKLECMNIFKAAGSDVRMRDIKFCRRIGARGEEPRPLLVGMKTEDDKRNLLECARKLQNTDYKNVHIGPDLTKKQRQEEGNLKNEAERRNKEELTQEDKSKNLVWMVVGAKGERRLIKSVRREERSEGRGGNTRRSGAGEGDMEGRRKETGTRRKEPFNKRIRHSSSGSDMDQDQPTRRRTRR